MRRYTFYILIALFTFGIGSLITLKLYWKTQENLCTPASSEFLNNLSKRPNYINTFPKPFDPSKKQEVKPTKPFCYNKNILPIWKVLLKQKAFQLEWKLISDQSLDCKDMLRIKKIDLNQDGNKEILVRGNSFPLCSAVGNCGFWIYEKQGKSYRKLLYSSDYIDVNKMGEQILKKKTNGYSDILLKSHFTAADTTYTFYKFDGKKYKVSKDLVETPIVGTYENPKWEFITWKEFRRRNHY